MKQRGLTQTEFDDYGTVSIAGIQSRRLDMLYGSYRTVFKLDGSDGGACAGFFWYHDDRSEVDIEIVTTGTSFVNNTISFTSHPSLAADGQPIPNATVLKSLSDCRFQPHVFREYRFDIHPDLGVQYFVDGTLVHVNRRNVPGDGRGGNLQFKLWADGNSWWSGRPSTTDVFLTVKSIVAYFNTSSPDPEWLDACEAAGGPSQETVCLAK
ncbi:hypothetical protein A1O7_04079 [Cladophialophora yegresii CBS 114405]|uniref:GH16 domain-containing protein n=1 Tax=Cladophialophora yegresii CBS 114405 TaxID=1182544 RepID=W9W5X7_9EURO|nr:uncharacterized protein A1O7_04079 [Cladophialophora yegresii CBS 114405]EXJ59931.1 hypothetical protein A1O7_04079 [Cladophialophora yegresii CBS 114405]